MKTTSQPPFQQKAMAFKIKFYCFHVNKSIFSWLKLIEVKIFIHLAIHVTNWVPPPSRRGNPHVRKHC